MADCLVCEGTPGKYPIINSRGKHLYNIACPECDGKGNTFSEEDDEEREQELFATLQREKYEAALIAMRSATV